MDNQPLVSVGIPTYNRPEGLRRTLDCITKQTYKNLEIIISDNCSPNPESEKVAREFIEKDPRIKYFKQSKNIGVANNFKFVLEKATSVYFMWAADDDYFESTNLIENLVNEISTNILVFPNINIFNSERNIQYGALNIYLNCITSWDYLNVWTQNLTGYPFYGLYNLEKLQQANIWIDFDSGLVYHSEGTFLHKIFLNGDVKFIPEIFIRIDNNGYRPDILELINCFNIFSKRSFSIYFRRKIKNKSHILRNIYSCFSLHFSHLYEQSKTEKGSLKTRLFLLNKPIMVLYLISINYETFKLSIKNNNSTNLIKQYLKKIVRKSLSLLGLKLTRIPSRNDIKISQEILKQMQVKQASEIQELKRKEQIKNNLWLIDLRIETVLDIGANTGQFAEKILSLLPDVDLYCFEPIKLCIEELKKNLGLNERIKYFNFALGDENGERTIHLNEYSPSSSLLEMNKLHKEAFTFTEKTTQEKIEIRRLDEILVNINLVKPILIKIDVQGFEIEVLKGGLKTIKQADIIIIETTFEELYIGQPLFHEIYTFLNELGFIFKGNFEQLTSPIDGKILQADSIFFKM